MGGSGNTITAGANATLAFAGSSNDNVVTMGSGGAVSIADGDHGEVVNETGGTVTLGNGAAATVVGNESINGGTGSTLTLSGIDTVSSTNDKLYLGGSTNITTSGTGATIYTGLNDVITGNGDIFNIGGNLLAGQVATTGYTTINGTANIVNAGTGTMFGLSGIDTVNGTSDKLFLTGSANLTTNGTGMTVYTGLNDVITGNGDIFNIGGNLLAGQVATTGYTTINGNANTVNAGTGTMFGLSGSDTLNGTNDKLFLTDSANLTTSGAGMTVYTDLNDVIHGSGLTVDTGGNLQTGEAAATGYTTIVGSANTINAGIGTMFGLSGSDNVFGTSDKLFLTDSASLTAIGAGMTVYTDLNNVINGTGLTVNTGGNLQTGEAASSGYTTIVGNANTINAGTGTMFGLSGSDTLNGTNDKLFLTDSANLTAIGAGMTVYTDLNNVINGTGLTVNTGGNLQTGEAATSGYTTIVGNANTINAGTGTMFGLSGSDTLNGTNDKLFLTDSANLTAIGAGMTVYTDLNNVINGTGLTVNTGGNLQTGEAATSGYTTIVGNANTINAGTGTMFGLSGSDTVNGTSDKLFLTDSANLTAIGAGMTVYTDLNNVINGTGLTVDTGGNLQAGEVATSGYTTIVGNANTVNAGTGTSFGLSGSDTVFGTSDKLFLTDSASLIANGAGMTVYADLNDVINGAGLTVNLGGNLQAGELATTGTTTINSDSATIFGGTGNTFSLGGNSDIVYATNSSITLLAANENVLVDGVDTIHGMAGDTVTENLAKGSVVDSWDSSGNETAKDWSLANGQGQEDGTSSDPTLAENSIDLGVPVTTPPPIDPPIEPPPPIDPPIEPPPPIDPPVDPPIEPPSEPPSDPIILNLQGQKVQTTSLSGSNAYFDMQNNGQKVQTGWATPGEGMLVYDPNNTGTVTNDANLVAGFGALSTLANQTGGVLNASNPLWNELKVWVDPTGDANFQQGELYSLSQLGISSINLNSTAEQVNNKGNTILNDSTFTWNNGTTGDIAGVNLAFNQNAVASPATATSGSDPALSQSVNLLIQAMATFNSDHGMASTLSQSHILANPIQLAPPSSIAHHA
ncbi:hypothetical protein CPter291_3531 [Collimonas pratensis]|uniref:Uncharacterized protein n=1 Tax=Collimonas pratensis TaxID=279113 RepID=A0ABN4MCE6_9BURK|nr:hypothetical protein CPter291_3531 [Collimonas pratensis]